VPARRQHLDLGGTGARAWILLDSHAWRIWLCSEASWKVLVTGEKKRSTSSGGECKKNMAAGGRWEGKNIKTPYTLGCEKNDLDSKCAFEQNNFLSIRYVARHLSSPSVVPV
jgi:hypothetical protein